ncbi:MAG: C25 family cysteine peptidase [Planctomycetota bacterium]|nr:C25 family cysteine peptidase [Planctomycetota bacterium]
MRGAVWQGGTPGALTAWNEPANWSSGAVPGTGDHAIIPSYPTSGYFPDISATPLHAIDRLEVQGGATLTIGSGMTLQLLGASSDATLSGTGTINGSGTLEIAAATDADRTLFQHSMSVSNLRLNSSYSGRKYTVPAGVAVSTGTVAVDSGVLVANGALYSSGATTLASGMMLMGIGTAGNIVASGMVSPGNSVGRLRAASADFSAGGTLRIEIANETDAGADKLELSGALVMGGGSTLLLDLAGYAGADRQFTVVESASWSTGQGFKNVQVTGTTKPVAVGYESDAVTGRKKVNVGVGVAPTPARLETFTARADEGAVQLAWRCASEFENLGFHVWRRALGTREGWTRANTALIAGRLTSPDPTTYALLDHPVPGDYEYRLESVSVRGARELYGKTAGPVRVEAAGEAAVAEAGRRQFEELGVRMERAVARRTARSATVRLASPRQPLWRNVALGAATPAPAAARAGSRAFAEPQVVAKVVYSGEGVLRVPQSSLPPGFDARSITVQRGGRCVTALSADAGGLVLYAPGYADCYTDKDAFFLTPGSACHCELARSATGLFAADVTASTTTVSTATKSFHDVYFDWAMRPYDYEPWFSNQYLTDGSVQSFTLDLPGYSSGGGTLALRVWSLTESGRLNPDHSVQVFVNGMAAGSAEWDGGGKMLELSLAVPDGVLLASGNTVELRTPDLRCGQVAFVHSLAVEYLKTLAPGDEIVLPGGGTPQLFEVGGLAGPELWVVDARDPENAGLVPYETQGEADGTFRARFQAAGGGRYLVVPCGQETAPLFVTRRSIASPPGGLQYLAVGPSQFAAALQPLIDARTAEGLAAAFVDQEDLFDFYGFGRYGPEAIRAAVRAVRPAYLLLVGRTTFDYRNYTGANVDPLCPSFLLSTTFFAQTVSDPSFGDLGNGYAEVSIGRMPVNTPEELSVAVARTLAYPGMPVSGQRALLAADRPDPAAGDFAAECEALAASAPEIAWRKAYLGVTYAKPPQVTEAMREAACGGADFLLYSGHGSSRVLGLQQPGILDRDSVKSWTGNVVLLQATCNGNWFARNERDGHSIASQAMTQPQGGAVASISAATYMLSPLSMEFMTVLLRQSGPEDMRWGQAVLKTQQWAYATSATAARNGSWYADLARTECLLGDPALPMYQRQVAVPGGGGGTGGGGEPGGGSGDGGNAGAGAAPLGVSRLHGVIVFGTDGRDMVRIAGRLQGLPRNLTTDGMLVRVSAGGAERGFTLSHNGLGKLVRSRLSLARPNRRGERAYCALLAGTFSSAWSNAGFVATDCRRARLSLDIEMDVGGTLYRATVPVWYSAKARASGTFRK